MKSLKRIILTTGVMISLFGAPIVQNNPLMDYMNSMTTITAMAAEQQSNLPYSRFWETQADGSWKYKYDDGTYATGWIQDDVDGNWYYMDSAGIMKSGLYKSYDRYYLLSGLHDGHYGHLLTNGEVYQGVTISADTSETYMGALSQQTISQLGLDVSKAIDITGTQHVKGGQVVTPEQPQQNPTTQSNGGTGKGGSTTSSTDDMSQTGKITDPNDLKPGQFAIIDGHMWARDPSSGTLYDMGSTAGSTDGGTSIEIH